MLLVNFLLGLKIFAQSWRPKVFWNQTMTSVYARCNTDLESNSIFKICQLFHSARHPWSNNSSKQSWSLSSYLYRHIAIDTIISWIRTDWKRLERACCYHHRRRRHRHHDHHDRPHDHYDHRDYHDHHTHHSHHYDQTEQDRKESAVGFKKRRSCLRLQTGPHPHSYHQHPHPHLNPSNHRHPRHHQWPHHNDQWSLIILIIISRFGAQLRGNTFLKYFVTSSFM